LSLKTKNLSRFLGRGPRCRLRELTLPLLLISGQACAPAPSGQAPAGDDRLLPVYSADTGRLSELQYDSNRDGKPDMRAFMEGTRLLRAEVDEDADGRTDRWEYYVEGTRLQALETSAGSPEARARLPLGRVEISSRRDGSITRREFYERGAIARVEEDVNGDGKTDRWESYTGGRLTVMALDLSHRGSPERRFLYARDGAIAGVEIDPDGDGVFTALPDQATQSSARPAATAVVR
jgi:hypothetical protein